MPQYRDPVTTSNGLLGWGAILTVVGLFMALYYGWVCRTYPAAGWAFVPYLGWATVLGGVALLVCGGWIHYQAHRVVSGD